MLEKNISITEPAKELPVAGEADVVVVGGGLAGVAAAVAAARNGAKVILIEKSIVLGGLATLGHVCIYLPIDDGLGHKVYGGLAEELLHVCIKYGYDNLPDCWRSCPDTVEEPAGRYRTNFNIPAAVCALDELVQNEGIEVVFDTNFCAPIMEGKTCKGVIVENKSGRSAYLAKTFVDASGDLDLLARAGAPNEVQKSIVSHWAHEIDLQSMAQGLEKRSALQAAPLRWLGLRPDFDNSGSEIPTYDGVTSEGVNGYIRTSRRLVLDYLKTHNSPEYAQLTLPLMAQFRMTRRLIGMEELALNPGAHVESSVGCMINSLANPAEVYEFPYGGLIDREITNIAAAGRIVSATGAGWEVARFIPACVLSGEAAGTAAAMAAQQNVSFQALDVPALQEKLTAAGVKVHMAEELRKNRTGVGVKKSPKQTDHSLGVRADALAYPHE
ncbi:MAG: FAD-dependent oxidoreductase [Oscillospiraceae bacterium]|nr:FAD-dependent oxidoreductase [Oscillospiraceae bacterium]